MNFSSSLTASASGSTQGALGGALGAATYHSSDVDQGVAGVSKIAGAVGGSTGKDLTIIGKGAAAGAATAGSVVGSAVALGAITGSVVPVVGTAIGAGVGAVIAFFSVAHFGRNPHPGMDDAYWGVLGKRGKKHKEPTGQTISDDQSLMVDKYVKEVTSIPNWQLNWPVIYHNDLAHGTGDHAHSTLLANAVARRLHAPENGGVMVTPQQMASAIINTFVAALTHGGCPSNDVYLAAAHAALSRAASEGPQVLALVQQKVSLVESFGLAANGLTAQVNACRAANVPKPRPIVRAPVKAVPSPAPPSNLTNGRWWAEVFVASTVAVGLGLGVQHIVQAKGK